MRNFRFIILILSLLLLQHADAAEKKTSMKLGVNYGDKVTLFEIPDANKLEVIVNGRKKKTLRSNIDQAMKLALAASKEKSNQKALCYRKVIELVYQGNGAKESRTFGCINSKTPAATKLTELSNLMLFM